MNESKNINVYETVEPNIFTKYEDKIRLLFFKILSKKSKQKSFFVDETTGHFSYRYHKKLAPLKTPQIEAEAKKVIDFHLHQLKQTNQKFSELYKDFPNLFDKKFMRFKSISPVYDSKYKNIKGWKALFHFELEALEQKEKPPKKAVLEQENIEIEISGYQMIAFDYKQAQ